MRRILLVAAWVAMGAGGARAQSAGVAVPCPAAAAGDSARADAAAADVVIVATVHADEVRFDRQPNARLRVAGCPEGAGLRVLERRNLPERVQPGVTYRDVQVTVRILGALNAACIAALAGDSAAARALSPGGCVAVQPSASARPPD